MSPPGPAAPSFWPLFEAWGIAETLKPRLVQAPPGVPVGTLVARGEVALGFQQLSELLPLPGITVVGTLPEDAACITTFSAAPGLHTPHGARGAGLVGLPEHTRRRCSEAAPRHGTGLLKRARSPA